MKFKLSNLIWGSALLFTTGCKKFVESGDVNINPNKPAFVTLNTLLPAVEDATANSQGYVAFTTSLFSQQMAAYQSGPIDDDRNRDVRMSSAYYSLYQTSLTNSHLMIAMAQEQGSPSYAGIAHILFVYNLMMATDAWGEVPYSQAFQAPSILYPGYDKQEDLYPLMHAMLDSAINETQATNPAALKPGTDDLVFSGDMTAWLQTAYFIKAKLYMHTTKKGAAAAANSALTALGNGYTSGSKVFQLVYNDKNQNPWFKNVAGRIVGAVYTIGPSKRFIDALNGTSYPGLIDPRLTVLVDKKSSASYTGLLNGSGGTGNTTDVTNNTFFAKSAAPLLFGSYAEQKLMEAEALFLSNGGNAGSVGSTQAAYDAYYAGIAYNLKYLGIDTAAGLPGNDYLNNAQVAVGAAGLTLELIMRERQVALFLNPEAWDDVRRYDYNPALFTGMELPQNQDPEMSGNYIRRSGYPLDEINRNPNVPSDKKLFDKVWWDQ